MADGESTSETGPRATAETRLVTPPGRDGPPGPIPLLEYYRSREVTPAKYLAALRAAQPPRIDRGDSEQVLKEIAELDPRFQKTLALVSNAVVEGRGDASVWVLSFARDALAKELRRQDPWPGAGETRAHELFDEIAQGLRGDLRNPKTAWRASNLLRAAALWLGHDRGLDITDALPVIASVVPPPSGDRTRRSAQRERTAFLAKLRGKEDMSQLVEVLSPWIRAAREARSDAARLEGEAEELRARASDALREARHAQGEAAALREALGQAQAKIVELEKQLQGAQVLGMHGVSEVRSRQSAFLNKRLRRLLDTAMEASSSDHPSPRVVVENLELALEVIDEEIEWLRSSA
jgi:hypothetical protein